MVDQNKKEDSLTPEKKIPVGDQSTRFEQGLNSVPQRRIERKETSPYESVVSDELKKEIEMMELDDTEKVEAKKKAEKIEFLGEKEKVEHLLDLAREKGVVFAIQVAKKMGDSYILDILHDILAQEGLYKKMTPSDDDQKKQDDKKKKDDKKNKK